MSGSLETVALAGNPNAGKTTIFNALTGANQQVGNYAGVTVERKSGEFFTPHGRKLRLVDLPGCYSLEGGSPDQQIARKVLLGELEGEARPDLVVCVVDGSALERHLQLTLEVIETGLPVVVALNMVDVAEKTGIRLDVQKLSEELGVPVVPMQANAGKGMIDLKQAIRHPFPPVATVNWSPEERQQRAIRICDTAARRKDSYSATLTDKIDSVLLHPVLGWVFFAAIMFCVFWTIFAIADIPIGWIEGGTEVVANWVTSKMPEGDLRSLLVDGVINGVGGGVLVFLPQIVMLFFFIGLLESSGYMARAA
ncbi:MAG: ferrous iron transporter B, partial [Verrucomicrobiaceae bacterium]